MNEMFVNETLALMEEDKNHHEKMKQKAMRIGLVVALISLVLGVMNGLPIWFVSLFSALFYYMFSILMNHIESPTDRPYYLYDYFHRLSNQVHNYNRLNRYHGDGRISYIVETNCHTYFVQTREDKVIYLCQLMNQLQEMEVQA